jgi:hypothetical protein
MHFLTLQRLLPVESPKDLYIFWLRALAYRRGHEHLSGELAHFVFLNSNTARAAVKFDQVMDDITYEFASLESPSGTPRDVRKAWTALESIVNKEYLTTHSNF